MRQFYRDQLCQPYASELEEMEAGAELTWQELLEKSAAAKWGAAIHSTDRSPEVQGYTYSRHAAEPPASANFVVAGIDVQQNRVYTEASAYSMDGTSYDAAWAYQYARPDQMPWSRSEIGDLLNLQEQWLRSCCGALPLVAIGLDVGDSTDELMAFLATKRGGVWRATKGASSHLKDEPGDIPGIINVRNGIMLLQTDSLRTLIHSALRRPAGQAGAINLPAALRNNSSDTAYLRHLVAEQEVFDHKTKKIKLRHGPGRWDWHDARRITHAMALYHLRKLNRPATPQRQYGAIGKI
jgi:phage terminase large subunit GpA-like protein